MFDPTTLTGFHTWLSILAIVAGIPMIAGLLRGSVVQPWSMLYLWMAIATSATGFLFPFNGILPSHVIGAISLVVLVPAAYALHGANLRGAWRMVFVITAMIGMYLLVFVAIAQAFLKVPALNLLAPTQAEPPFAIAQGVAFVVFAVLTWLAARRSAPAGTLAV